MTNIFQDLANNAIFTAGNTYGTAISGTGILTGVDLIDGVANRVAAMVTCSAVASSGNVTIKIQESSDNVTFTDLVDPITGVAYTFSAITAANTVQLISFNTNKRYVAGYATLNSGTSVTAQLTFIADRRVTPTSKGGFVNDPVSPG